MTVDLEFLIQKEGDYEWLPLESLSVEILVGRYQLIAQASEADCPIQVHIRHQYVQDGIWQEVVQQQLLHTDSQGRIEVFPPTFLQHGRWIISCAPQQDQRFGLSEIDCHCVQLQVLTHDIDLDQEWEFIDQPFIPQPEPCPNGADDLQPLFAADISAKTAWNNFAPAPEEFEPAIEEFESASEEFELAIEAFESSAPEEFELVIEAFEMVNGDLFVSPEAETADFTAPNVNPAFTQSEVVPAQPSVPKLPEIPKNIPPIHFEISPGLILPPELFNPDLEPGEVPPPQLPVFPHLDNWANLSYKELSIALGRLYWSKLDAYGEAIDVDFESLDLQTRFLQNLQQLALQDPPGSDTPHDINPFIIGEQCKALVPLSPEGES